MRRVLIPTAVAMLLLAPAPALAFAWKLQTVIHDYVNDPKRPPPETHRPKVVTKTYRHGDREHAIDSPPGWACVLDVGDLHQMAGFFRQYASIRCIKGKSRASTTTTALSTRPDGGGDAELTVREGDIEITFSLESVAQ